MKKVKEERTMKEVVKILLIVILVSGVLLLMGCGSDAEDTNGRNANSASVPGSGFQMPTNGAAYFSTSSDGEWEVSMLPSRDIMPDQFHGEMYIDIQLTLLDKRCGQTYVFQRDVYMGLGGVIQTYITAPGNQRLYANIYGTEYPGHRKVLEGTLILTVPPQGSCRVNQQWGQFQQMAQTGVNSQGQNPNVTSGFPMSFRIQLI